MALKPEQLHNCWSEGRFLQKPTPDAAMAITAGEHLNVVDLDYCNSQGKKKSFFLDSLSKNGGMGERDEMKEVFQSKF